MIQTDAEILLNKNICGRYYKMRLDAGGIVSSQICPGQFIHIRIGNGTSPLLRRPFSIYRSSGDCVEILYEARGKSTVLLSQAKEGDKINVIVPLGNGFRILERPSILAAGGIGIAPLVFLAERLMEINAQVLVLMGVKTKDGLLCEEEFKKLRCEVQIAADDGSAGFKGSVTELLENILSARRISSPAIYSCGPTPMLKQVCRIALAHHLPCQVSMEEVIACGVGACLGCAVEVKGQKRYKLVCKDGPIFDAEEIIL